MKKYIFSIIMILCVTLIFFAGCKNTDTQETTAPTQASTQSIPEETKPQQFNFIINAFSFNGIEYQFTLEKSDGTNTIEQSFNTLSVTLEVGETVKDALDKEGYANMKMIELHDEFSGWMEYKVTPSDDGLTSIYEKMSDTLYTTDELMLKTVDDCSVTYVAKWKNIDADYYAAYGY